MAVVAAISLLSVAGCRVLAGYQAARSDTRDTRDIAASPRDGGLDVARDIIRPRDLKSVDAVSDGGGWQLVVDYDPTTSGCPAPWSYVAGVGGCAIASPTCGDNIAGQSFSSPLGSYREVRIYIEGRQFFSTDAFRVENPLLNGVYVDGVSITWGAPRRHVFTFASGLFKTKSAPGSCPCQGGQAAPAFVNDNWTCDSGNLDTAGYPPIWQSVPLWDGDSEGPDCKKPAAGWYEVALKEAASGPLEVRLMTDQCDENVAFTRLKLYVR